MPYLQAGMWVGERATCREFFAAAGRLRLDDGRASMPPDLDAWEQPRYVRLLPDFHPRVRVDHRCGIFQSLTCPSADVDLTSI